MSGRIPSIERAAAVLRLLTGRSRRRGVADLAYEMNLPKGTVYGILRTLMAVGFVEQDSDSRKYQLGAALLPIGSSYLDGNELRRRAVSWADALATQTAAGVRVGTVHEHRVLIVHHALGPGNGLETPEVGSLMPLHATALGKALLAHHRDLVGELVSRGLAGYTSATLTDRHRLAAELAAVADRGWAGDVAEFLPGVASIAAPVRDHARTVVGAIAVSGPVERICESGSPRLDLAGHIIHSASGLSRELGGGSW
ncbi:MAG: IclR family transcriptional regulator [Solirubrobacteraceae bacterium]